MLSRRLEIHLTLLLNSALLPSSIPSRIWSAAAPLFLNPVYGWMNRRWRGGWAAEPLRTLKPH
jgi:hypothetical protein